MSRRGRGEGRGRGGGEARRAAMPHAACRTPHAACRMPRRGRRLPSEHPFHRRPSAPRPATTASAAECLTVTPNRHRAASPGMYTWAWALDAWSVRLFTATECTCLCAWISLGLSHNQKVQHVGYWLLPCGALWAPLRSLETSVPRRLWLCGPSPDTPTLTHSTRRARARAARMPYA